MMILAKIFLLKITTLVNEKENLGFVFSDKNFFQSEFQTFGLMAKQKYHKKNVYLRFPYKFL